MLPIMDDMADLLSGTRKRIVVVDEKLLPLLAYVDKIGG
jgi:hypothetical protein